MSSSSLAPVPVSRRQPRTARLSAPLISIGVVLLAFAPTLLGFIPMWWEADGQGFVAAGFTAYLLWRDRAKLLDFRVGVPEVALLTAGLSLLWLVAFVLNVQVVHQASVPLILLGWLLAVGGTGPFIVALPIVGIFFLAIPVWSVFIGVLQSMTIFVNGLLLDVAGIQAVVKGETIEITSGVFWVAQGCAGLNYFQTSLLISSIYALLFLKQWKYRAAAIGVALVLAIISNWLRVFGLIVIGHATEMQSSLIAEHAFYGWVIFAVAMLAFFFIARPIENKDAETARAADAAAITTNADLPDSPVSHSRTVAAPQALLLPTLAAVVGPVLFLMLGGRTASGTEPLATPGIQVERADGQLAVLVSRTDRAVEPSITTDSSAAPAQWQPMFDGADVHRMEEFSFAKAPVRVDRFIYTTQDQGKELITATNQIVATENSLAQQVLGPLDETGRMVNSTIVRTPEGPRLVWHWFSVGGFVTQSSMRAKLMELIAFVRSNSPPAELITVSTLCAVNDCGAANETLYDFVVGRPASNTRPAQ